MYFVEKTKGINAAKQFDYFLFISVLLLSIFGIIVLSSATLTFANPMKSMTTQVVSLVVGAVLAIIVSSIDYKDFKVLGVILYIISIALLVLVLFMGKGENTWGSRSWLVVPVFGQFQPSEIAKITFVMTSSMFLERIVEGTNKVNNMIKFVLYAALPIGLILLQPDTGTAIVFMVMLLAMVYVAGIPYKYIWISGGAFLASLPIFWFFVLKKYQKDRILAYIFPQFDPKGGGYQVRASKWTIGSGQIFGKGLYEGIQTQNSMVPEKQTDFIFTVIGEELGFIGAVSVILVIFIILLRCLYIARNSRDPYGSFLVVGMSSMLAFHFIENIGMCIGLTPVTGIPLPFISLGGSSMVTNYIAIGIILSVSMRRKRTIFNNMQ
ncbi:MAG: rod shape-determining protein RodA [Clostridia bacterium]|nr:rod shape-determining protein RodA [Clostridia bacterium]